MFFGFSSWGCHQQCNKCGIRCFVSEPCRDGGETRGQSRGKQLSLAVCCFVLFVNTIYAFGFGRIRVTAARFVTSHQVPPKPVIKVERKPDVPSALVPQHVPKVPVKLESTPAPPAAPPASAPRARSRSPRPPPQPPGSQHRSERATKPAVT
jgi:hypothetical protein